MACISSTSPVTPSMTVPTKPWATAVNPRYPTEAVDVHASALIDDEHVTRTASQDGL